MNLAFGDIPNNLSAQEYYELGLQYRLAGRVGLAREALVRAVKLQSCGPIAGKAEKVLRTQLPLLPVSEKAERRNIEAYNLMGKDPQRAKKIFQELMFLYPDFEWPFSNLAWMKLNEGDLFGAKGLAKHLLSMNPDHLRSIDLMIKVSLGEKDFSETLKYVDRALELYPHNEEFTQWKVIIKMETSGPPPDTIPDDLHADQYYNLGIAYLLYRKFENARKALNLAIEKDDSRMTRTKAAKLIKTELPKVAVPREAEARCVELVEAMQNEADRAREIFTGLRSDYPDFEYPLMVMASGLFSKGKAKEAESLILRVLESNPDYIKAKRALVELYMSEKRVLEALDMITQSRTAADSEDEALDLDLLRAQCQLLT
ncbi:hypothetical protein BH10CYA1_BH10CYA1_61490 [soil metagenome]